jgi:acetyl esterase
MGDPTVDDEGVLDPWVVEWMAANPERATPFADLVPELLELARGDYGPQLTQEIDHVDDESVGDIPVRVYRDDGEPTGLVVYFHGGGHVIGSIGIMDGVAREIAHASGAVVVSVEYRLAPEHPYPAAVDDCAEVTSWAFGQCDRFGVPEGAVAVVGESAGGTMAAAVSLRLRDAGGPAPVGQVLIYPAVAGSKIYPSREEFSGLVISLEAGEAYWAAYSGGRDLDDDPYAVPLSAPSLAGLPPALVLLGGCDMLRDEGRAYADRMRADGVDVEEVCYPGQPHGFVNFGFPAAAQAFERTGEWLRRTFQAARAGE